MSEGAIVWDKRKVFVALCYTCRGMDVVESCVEGRDVYDQNIIFFNNLSCDTLMLRTEAMRGKRLGLCMTIVSAKLLWVLWVAHRGVCCG